MKLGAFHFSLFLSLTATIFSSVICYDRHDPRGNITVRWDILSWTPDGYLAVVNITNYQRYRPVQAPGWQLSWTWSKREVIWNVLGATTTNQGDCSKYKANVPSSCEKRPTIVDLTAGAPLINQIEGCCRGGTLTAREEDMETSTAGFQLAVGEAGTTNATVALPHNFTLQAPREGYTCGSARVVDPTRFLTFDRNRFTQALMTWQVVCTYSTFLANKAPPCCVSWSSFDHWMSATCSKCACNCMNISAACGRCVLHLLLSLL
ncbi:protein COBRA-like [Magnolia sinica]|uniref:protein COBRA-like n=1 Tax=Magnolia sinica TaxID=86752 RepID=UPI0026582364|nr:protein COBRA-like [Magnolia sinica]